MKKGRYAVRDAISSFSKVQRWLVDDLFSYGFLWAELKLGNWRMKHGISQLLQGTLALLENFFPIVRQLSIPPTHNEERLNLTNEEEHILKNKNTRK